MKPGDDEMDNDMDDQMDDMEGVDHDAEENGMDDEDEEGEENGEKNEYVKKEFVAGVYKSQTLEQTIAEVQSFTIKNSR